MTSKLNLVGKLLDQYWLWNGWCRIIFFYKEYVNCVISITKFSCHPPNTKIKTCSSWSKKYLQLCCISNTCALLQSNATITNIVLPNWKLDFLKHHIQIHLCFILYSPSILHERICNGRLQYFISLYPKSYISKHPFRYLQNTRS